MKRPGVGVGVFIFKDGQFLMIKREGAHGAGSWSVPGGWMEYGESFEETAKREVMEEVGLKIDNLRFGAVTNNVFKTEKIHSVTIWVISDYKKGQPKIMVPDKISKLLWCGFDSLPEPLFSPWKELLSSKFIDDIKKQLK
ncbi:MAG TPA: NUDIX domain-containing protein [Nitrososphaera sp.]|jgi:8-oxo-dGTP diphosphatase|nr:NUDIX domain-containing protein [Nitrososphaera sp.]